MNGYPLGGCQIKTKGPKVLKMEGHTKEKIRPNSPDYRPFTDCSFFMEGAKCKKGKSVSLGKGALQTLGIDEGGSEVSVQYIGGGGGGGGGERTPAVQSL